MKTIRLPAIAMISISLLALIVFPAACSGGGSQALMAGNPVPDFKLKNLEGNTISLSSLRGQVIILNFWSTTCPPCEAEMPHLEATYDAWKDKGFMILAIDIGEDAATVKEFMTSRGLNIPVLLDNQFKVAEKYGIRYTPTTFVIDREGKLQSQVIGAFQNQAAIEKKFVSLLD